MAALLGLPTAVREHSSPSARLVWLALREADAPLSTTALAVETGVSLDQLRRVLGTLQETDLVEAREHPADGRKTLWASTLSDREDGDDTPDIDRSYLEGV